jgi:hypothetical protein
MTRRAGTDRKKCHEFELHPSELSRRDSLPGPSAWTSLWIPWILNFFVLPENAVFQSFLAIVLRREQTVDPSEVTIVPVRVWSSLSLLLSPQRPQLKIAIKFKTSVDRCDKMQKETAIFETIHWRRWIFPFFAAFAVSKLLLATWQRRRSLANIHC